jgi:ribose 5-phosphate isomerase B
MKIIIASDHAGYELKERIIEHFNQEYEWENIGTFSSESVDYPDFAHPLAEKISDREFEYGILICGTGNGIGMTANKHAGVRAAICWNVEIAALARQHNNANVLVLPARFITEEDAFKVVKTFFSTDFEGGRHQRRVEKINIQ